MHITNICKHMLNKIHCKNKYPNQTILIQWGNFLQNKYPKTVLKKGLSSIKSHHERPELIELQLNKINIA